MSPDGPSVVPPEEKLLRLIRGKGSPPRSAGPHPAQAVALAGRGAPPSVPSSIERAGVPWRLPSWWLTAVNVGLGCLLVGELLGVIALGMKAVPAAEVSLASVQPPPSKSAPPTHPGASPDISAGSMPSLSSVVSRPFFEAAHSPTAPTVPESKVPSTTAKELAARLSLIGVVSGEPAQAIIEDAQTKKTYFVSVGQGVVEGFVVEAVSENRAVLHLNGEKIELSL